MLSVIQDEGRDGRESSGFNTQIPCAMKIVCPTSMYAMELG